MSRKFTVMAIRGIGPKSRLAGGGGVSTALGDLVRTHPPGGEKNRSPVETIAEIIGRITGVGLERQAHRKIRRHRNRLTRAVGAFHRQDGALDRLNSVEQKATRAQRDRKFAEHHSNDLRGRFNSAVSLISAPFLLMLEAIVVMAELTFYYYSFSADLDADAGWLERAMVIVLSLFIPIAGIAAARWFAAAFTALRGLSEQDKTKRAFAYVSAVAATATLIAIAWAVYRLVVWRYTGQSIAGLSAHPPETVMASVFVLVLILDAGIRAFVLPVTARSDAHLARSIRRDRRVTAKAINRRGKALTRWISAWTALQTVLNVLLDDAERALSAADVHVLTGRARSTAETDTHATVTAAKTTDHGRRIEPHLDLPHIEVKLRLIDAAFAHLDEMKPPALVVASSDSDQNDAAPTTVRTIHGADTGVDDGEGASSVA
ncbi:MAG: hypothetical protein V7697_28910 [Rhodococcus erythropolis]